MEALGNESILRVVPLPLCGKGANVRQLDRIVLQTSPGPGADGFRTDIIGLRDSEKPGHDQVGRELLAGRGSLDLFNDDGA